MENRAHAMITGLFLLGLTAAIVVAAQWLAGDRQVRVPYRVISTQPVSGLNAQATVRYRGMAAGRVMSIAIDPKDARRILIGVEVDENIPVTKGTYAQLGMEGITGVAYVHLLDDGNDPAPAAKGADGIPELAVKPSFFDSLSDSAEGISREARELIVSLNKVLTPENRERIGKTLASLESASAKLDATAQKLPVAIDRIDNRVATWMNDDSRKNFQQALQNINETARETQRLAQDARGLMLKLEPVIGQVGSLAGHAQGATASVNETTLPQVNALTETVERSAQRIGRLATELERKPDAVLWGRGDARPGPGEPGFQ